ncbi:MAG: M3 family oligoendopeptidase [Candidatus Thermoplasmatota archaeon]
MQMIEKRSSADGVRWRLEDLFEGYDDPRLDAEMKGALADAQGFKARYKGRIIAGLSPEEMLGALQEYEDTYIRGYKPLIYAELLFASDTSRQEHGALLARAQEQFSELRKHLLFFELEWCALDDEKARRSIESDLLAHYRHYLEAERRFKPHKLSEPEEQMLEVMANTGKKAFVRLFDEVLNRTQYELRMEGKKKAVPLDAALALLYDPDRKKRRAAWKAVTKGMKENARSITYILNIIVQDHAMEDRLRKYPDMMSERNLTNEVEDEVVETLLRVVNSKMDLVARYYALKRRLLRLRVLYDYDRYAPVGITMPTCDYLASKRIVLDTYLAFSPKMHAVAAEFFEKHWIDAEIRPGKEGGAFSASTTPDLHPYIKLNHTDNIRDVMTMAHELGHGIHQYLARKQGFLQMHTSLTTAETASVFGEMLVFHKLLAEQMDPRVKLALLCSKIEDTFATVFRQVMMTQFERRVHEARRTKGEQGTEAINQMWKEENQRMFNGSVVMTEEYAWWWIYVLHFFHYHFYTYAYAFGELLVLALYAQYQKEGSGFVDKYIALLGAGGSASPKELVARLGLDISDPKFWEGGMDQIEQMVIEAERLAKENGMM